MKYETFSPSMKVTTVGEMRAFLATFDDDVRVKAFVDEKETEHYVFRGTIGVEGSNKPYAQKGEEVAIIGCLSPELLTKLDIPGFKN